MHFNLFNTYTHAHPQTCVRARCAERRNGAVSFLPRITIASKGFTRRRGCRNGEKCGLILLSGLLSPLGGHQSRKNKFSRVYIHIIIYVYHRGRHVFRGPNICIYTHTCVLTFMLHVIAAYAGERGRRRRTVSNVFVNIYRWSGNRSVEGGRR